jgi:hypothetical protein
MLHRMAALCFTRIRSRFFEIALVPVYFDLFTSFIVNMDHSIMCAATMFRVVDCIGDFQIPQATERQRIGDQIKAAFIFARADFVNVGGMHSGWRPALWF